MKYPITPILLLLSTFHIHHSTFGDAVTTPPNVVVIFADDLGYGVGCYGATHVDTNIDRLAEEGRRFTDGHSASAVCTPSRYNLITGEYAFQGITGRRCF